MTGADEPAQPGEMVRIYDDEEASRLIEKGIARRLTHEEIEEILDTYIGEAKNVFRFPTERVRREQPGLWDHMGKEGQR